MGIQTFFFQIKYYQEEKVCFYPSYNVNNVEYEYKSKKNFPRKNQRKMHLHN